MTRLAKRSSASKKAPPPLGPAEPDRPSDSPADDESMEAKWNRQLAPRAKEMIDWLGRDTPEGQKLAGEVERALGPIARPTKAEPEQTQLIDLRLLKESLRHRREAPSEEELTALARSIAANGLKNPIEVRPDGNKFEIICGHRRAAAYRQLFDAAQSDRERAKYRTIRAKVRQGASDAEVLRQGIAEDFIREEFSPADAARSIDSLRELEPGLGSAPKLSEATGVPLRRVRRYLQLRTAPPVVQDAVRWGMLLDVEANGEDGAHQERRKLDLLAALELGRLHAALSTKRAGRKPADRAPDESDEAYANRQTRNAIERALTENWGYREVKRYVDNVVAARGQDAPKKNVPGRPRVPFKWEKQRLQVDVNRLEALNARQKAELRKVIQDILRRL